MKKQNRKTIRTFLLSLLVILAVLLGVYAAGIYQIVHFNSEMVIPDGDNNRLVTFRPDEQGLIYTTTGQPVTIDMGSRHCFITTATLTNFKRCGYPATEYPTLILTSDQSGHYRIYTRKVVMPIILFVHPDTTEIVRFENVELLISDKEEGNVIGMDFLERFVIERDVDTGEIALLRNVPQNYTYVCDINSRDSSIGDIIGYSRRMYIPLRVNDDEPQNYYMDTGRGIRSCELVQPVKNISKATSNVYADPETGMMTQDNCRVMIGNRMRFARVTYSDTLHTDQYSINPFKIFNRSIALDLPNRKLYYRCVEEVKDSLPLT
ncbi:MAG: hypothetical protein K2O38_06280 [Muribaculaceae bacterium]|nr:hypothetical protein [Muribaculaceae bacterium]MDE7111491.1 hypothetical protein [Muribaculaceae bacterium]